MHKFGKGRRPTGSRLTLTKRLEEWELQIYCEIFELFVIFSCLFTQWPQLIHILRPKNDHNRYCICF